MHLKQQKRRRGVLLTPQGLRKLENAKQQAEADENDSRRFTLNNLTLRTGLDSHTLCKIFNRTARVDQRSLVRCFLAFSLLLEPGDYELPAVLPSIRQAVPELNSRNDDGSLPDVSTFYGRTTELTTLSQWMRVDRCRLITLSGQGGMGKTHLAAKLVEQTQDEFKYVFWRSLYTAPSITDLLTQFIQSVSDRVSETESKSLNGLIDQVIDYLRSFRCLLVFDNLETILQSCDQAGSSLFAGHYCSDYEGYRMFLKRITETNHQSCVVLTSRELPQDIRQGVSNDLFIRSLLIKGLPVAQIQKILRHQGVFQGTLVDWCRLTHCYAGNPLILKSVGRSIQSLFGGNIAAFLNQDIVLFDEICDLLNQQLERLSNVEVDLITALARQSTPGSFSQMRSQVSVSISSQALLTALNSLNLRSLLEIRNGTFSLLPLVARHIKERYLDGQAVCSISDHPTMLGEKRL